MYDIKSLLRSISMDEMCKILENFKTAKVYEKDEYIFRQGQKTDSFYFLKSGSVKCFSTSSNGDERIVLVLNQKGIFAASSFFSDTIRYSSAIALSKSEIISIDKNMVDKLLTHDNKFSLCIIQDMSRDINFMFDQITSTTFLNAKQKVAHFISNCIENNHYHLKDNMICLNFTQEDIAKMLGLSRPTINKTLSYFKNQGWVETKYKYIYIHDYCALKSILG